MPKFSVFEFLSPLIGRAIEDVKTNLLEAFIAAFHCLELQRIQSCILSTGTRAVSCKIWRWWIIPSVILCSTPISHTFHLPVIQQSATKVRRHPPASAFRSVSPSPHKTLMFLLSAVPTCNNKMPLKAWLSTVKCKQKNKIRKRRINGLFNFLAEWVYKLFQ